MRIGGGDSIHTHIHTHTTSGIYILINDFFFSETGLKLVLTINPFISTQSYNFQFGVDQGLFVKERNSSTVPALTWFRDVTSAGLLGMVSNNTG